MSEKSEKIYDGITNISDSLAESAQEGKKRRKRPLPRWIYPTAAVLAIVIIGSALLRGGGLSAYAIAEAEYPNESVRVNQEVYAGAVSGFLERSIPVFLSGSKGENVAYSPLNVYMALSMLSELTDGNSREQVLSLLGSDSLEEQRRLAGDVWNSFYENDKYGKCVLAGSLWLDSDISYVQETMDTLAQSYYASSYRGDLDSSKLQKAMAKWINRQTDGKLSPSSEASGGLDGNSVMALVSTVYFRGKWSSEFSKGDTFPEVFHAETGDVACDFMHQYEMGGDYYWGERFSAVCQSFTNGKAMWYFLPDEGVTPWELLADEEFMRFFSGEKRSDDWENRKYLKIDLSVPKFDVTADFDLKEGLAELGVTDALDYRVSDYTPMTRDKDEIYLSDAKQATRVQIDEKGCTAVSYIKLFFGAGASMPPEDKVDFTLDRPFIFAVTDFWGFPIVAGIVADPTK